MSRSRLKPSGGAGAREAARSASAAVQADVAALFAQALGLHRAGRLGEAEPLYRKILDVDRGHVDARHHLGIIHHQRGEHIAAIRQIDAALEIDPNLVAAHNNRGVALAALQRSEEAAESYARAIALRPDYVDALFNRGNALKDLGRLDAALASYDRVMVLAPGHALAWANRGAVLHALRRYEAAVASYDQAIELKPDSGEAFNNRAATLAALGRFREALASFDAAIRLKPDLADAFGNRGNVLRELHRLEEALASYDAAIRLKPDFAEVYSNRSNALRDLRRFDEALASCERAIALQPDHAEYHNNRAAALYDMRRLDEAVASYDRAIALDPDYVEAHSNRGFALRDLRRYAESAASFARAFALDPDFDFLSGAYLHAKMCICDWTDFGPDCARLLSAVDAGRAAAPPFQLLAIPASPAQQLRAARCFAADKSGETHQPLWRGERYAHRRIRVAYLSADLRDHPITALTVGLFERHDRTRFETIAVSFKSDAHNQVSERLTTLFDRFVDARQMSDPDVARLVRDLEVDIAVDLNGHTEGARPSVFAWRTAPVQVNYLGFAATLGTSAWDYVIADRFVIPDADHAHYAEKVVYLPDCFMVNDRGRKISEQTPSRAEAGLPAQGFVFCCFNNSFKITPDIFDVWMRLLRSVEGSALWLSAANASAVANLQREAERRGIAADRLVFAPRVPLNEDHLARLRLADLFVDTLYYNAHATAADALWAGVPVLTCPGATFASRVAGSLLNAVGLPELMTGSLTEYEGLALGLARDSARLAALRQKLARNRDVCRLFDTDRFARNIEAAYTKMWERAQGGEPPRGFAVGDLAR